MKSEKEQSDMERNLKFEWSGQTHLNLLGETLISLDREVLQHHTLAPSREKGRLSYTKKAFQDWKMKHSAPATILPLPHDT